MIKNLIFVRNLNIRNESHGKWINSKQFTIQKRCISKIRLIIFGKMEHLLCDTYSFEQGEVVTVQQLYNM